MNKINITEKFQLISKFYDPKIVGEINESYVKLAKLKGDFPWHTHADEDEMFLIVEGELLLKFRDRDITLNPGEFIIVPKGVEHMPSAKEEVQALFIEPKSTVNTGTDVNERTLVDLEWI